MAQQRQARQKSRRAGGEAAGDTVRTDGAAPEPACWCGGELTDSIHPDYLRCAECATFVVKRQLNQEQLRQLYSFDNYWHDYAVHVKALPAIEQRAVDDFNDRIPAWFDLLRQLVRRCNPRPNLLLEIGCAHGGFLSYCRKHGIINVVGIAPDDQTCEFARKHFELPYVFSGLFPDVSLPFDRFGVIVGFDVVEHFPDPVRALRAVYDLLGSDGIFLFQIPCYRGEGREWPQFNPFEHLFLYDSVNISPLFDQVNLEIAKILPGCFPFDMLVVGSRKKAALVQNSGQTSEISSSTAGQTAPLGRDA